MSQSAHNRLWTAIQALMVCVALSHALQPLLLEWRPKFVVATGGALLYTLCAIGLFRRARWGLWIAAIGPLVGFTTLNVGRLLMWAGVIEIRFAPDVYTWIGAAFQVPALAIAVRLLRAEAPPVPAAP